MTGCSVRRWQCACGACVCVASAGCDRKWSQKWRLGFPFCRAHSAVVARPLCKRKAPGSISKASNFTFNYTCGHKYTRTLSHKRVLTCKLTYWDK
ncbi:hypothetical protein PR001_g24502 [Phytophthora rubi]|uniref:Uncharacterized protein n=2 Tax=Phytophthora TaxID=4783 RepID=A0A6A3IIS6_9STRA|nr:hypothetical protein PF003_g25752 [Phytophthora fragariae]KAE8922334.1 hypothetical protein PF009_g27406 [Phytophthora fragariae]KAE8979613.1 hypothetical protein PR001_g24502 [Phytophthora rubi]